jgi:acyl carrier protein
MTSDLTLALENLLRPKLRFLPADETLPMNRDLGALGLDSMATIDLLMDIETTMGISIPDEMITVETFSTAGHLLHAIQQAQS